MQRPDLNPYRPLDIVCDVVAILAILACMAIGLGLAPSVDAWLVAR